MTNHAERGDHRAAADGPRPERRRAAILEAVVTEYIGTAEPVGSSHVASAPGVKVSSATVRSEMAALEREGYLVQPHTSAGRIPTDKGYRFFVDHLTGPGVLGPVQRRQVTQFFEQVHGEMETVLEHASVCSPSSPPTRPSSLVPRRGGTIRSVHRGGRAVEGARLESV